MQTTSKSNTNSTSVDVLMINEKGVMISVMGQDYFLSYNRVPWMRLEVESLRHPERYPLLIRRNEFDFIAR